MVPRSGSFRNISKVRTSCRFHQGSLEPLRLSWSLSSGEILMPNVFFENQMLDNRANSENPANPEFPRAKPPQLVLTAV